MIPRRWPLSQDGSVVRSSSADTRARKRGAGELTSRGLSIRLFGLLRGCAPRRAGFLTLGLTTAAAPSLASSRSVLALYDGDAEANAAVTRIHRYAEPPHNHLGFTIEYRDICHVLPSASDLSRYAGGLTWF